MRAAVSTLLSIILAIIVGVLILTVSVKILSSFGISFSDELCRGSNWLRSKAVDKAGPFGTLIPRLCFERGVDVEGLNFEACPATAAKLAGLGLPERFDLLNPCTKWAEQNGLPSSFCTSLAKNCTTEQLAILAARCWYMYGQGKWSLREAINKDYPCFQIRSLTYTGLGNARKPEITEKDLVKWMLAQKTIGQSYPKFWNSTWCHYLADNDCDPIGETGGCEKCGSADHVWWDWYLDGTKLRLKKIRSGWHIRFHDHAPKAESWCSATDLKSWIQTLVAAAAVGKPELALLGKAVMCSIALVGEDQVVFKES